MNDRYDPEDLEALMSERSFDELLEEERRFVLRHVTDQEEYERMRRTLRYFRQADDDRAELVADSSVRDKVLDAYRTRQRRPRFMIWLNMFRAQFMPAPGNWNWRPALAIAGIALLLGVGVAYVQWWSPGEQNSLAELKEAPRVKRPEVIGDRPENALDQEPGAGPNTAQAAEEKEVDLPGPTEVREPTRADQAASLEDKTPSETMADLDVVADTEVEQAWVAEVMEEQEEDSDVRELAPSAGKRISSSATERPRSKEQFASEVAASAEEPAHRALDMATSAQAHAELHVLLRRAF